MINPTTEQEIGWASADAEAEKRAGGPRPLSYEEIGGLKRELRRIRDIIELPLRYPEVFDRQGIDPPKGVLLHGPPGCGKTLIARAVAHETDAKFFTINGPEIIHKFYGESEAHLRKFFDEAAKQAPSIIFFDEIDALVLARGSGGSDSGVTERVIGQFLAEMDGVEEMNGVLVLGATNRPDILDPALLRPGRFDIQLEIPLPDLPGRVEIFRIALRDKPAANEVAIEDLAARTEGFTGADIQGLCIQAARTALREALEASDGEPDALPAIVITPVHAPGSGSVRPLISRRS